MRRLLPPTAAALLLLSCATKPVVVPSERLKTTERYNTQTDIEACLAEARQAVGSGKGTEVAKSTAEGAVVGGAVGAATGAVLGEGRGAGAGAAGGAAGAFARSMWHWRDPDPVEKTYVNRCLARRGYEVLGWR